MSSLVGATLMQSYSRRAGFSSRVFMLLQALVYDSQKPSLSWNIPSVCIAIKGPGPSYSLLRNVCLNAEGRLFI